MMLCDIMKKNLTGIIERVNSIMTAKNNNYNSKQL